MVAATGLCRPFLMMIHGQDGKRPAGIRLSLGSQLSSFAQPVVLQQGESIVVELRQRSLRGYSNLQRFRLEWTDERGEASLALSKTPLEELAMTQGEVSPNLKSRLENQFLADRPALQRAQKAVAAARRRRGQYDSAAKPQSVTVLKRTQHPS